MHPKISIWALMDQDALHSSIFLLSDDDNISEDHQELIRWLKWVILLLCNTLLWKRAKSQCVLCYDIQTFIWSAREMVVTTRSQLPQSHFVLYVSIYVLQDSGQSLEGLPSSDRHCQPTLITAALPTAPFTIYNKYNSSQPGLNIQYGKQDFQGNICSKWSIND